MPTRKRSHVNPCQSCQHENLDDMLRTLRILVLAGLGAIALQCPSISLGQQTFPSFGEVDFFYSQNPQRFKDLWQAAHSQTVRIAVLGDSQESSPISHGFQYIPLLNYEMWKRFGNSPETPIEGCVHFGGGSSPPGIGSCQGAARSLDLLHLGSPRRRSCRACAREPFRL